MEGPQSARPSTSDGGPPVGGPVPLFDLHLKFLSDSHLAFFQERKRIEEIYIDSLLRLHKKVKAVDAFLDGNELSTARGSWGEVRDHVEREAQTRQAYLQSLVLDVINPLIALKDTQDRTRKRIKEDLKESTVAYNDYADNVLPRLKRNYMRKCQEVEDFKIATNPAIQPSQPLTGAETPRPREREREREREPVQPSAAPVVTSPQPLRPVSRRPSGSYPHSRNRSPSSGTALSDLAHQGKRQLNQLMTFLDKSATMKDGLSGRNDTTLRTVRAKRDAEEADKEYRKGVHWLETLRIRRVKILEAGYMSLELFIAESAERLKRALEKYTDNLTATSTTQTQLSSHLREAIGKISPAADVHALAQHIPRYLASATPVPTLYYNFAVGECNDLIFGVSLTDYAQSRALGDGDVPKIVRLCIQEVDQRGLDSEGIYRVSGRHALVQELQRKFERSERAFKFNPATDDVYVVASLLKLYLRELPEPVFKFPLQERIQHSEGYDEHKSSNFALLRAKMRRLPPVHQSTLKTIIQHLARVSERSAKNKMDVKNLAIVFGSVIFGEDEMPKVSAELLTMPTLQDSLMEDLIENAYALFDDRIEPPLPPAPSEETPATVAYGSAHTKVSSMPPPPTTPRREAAQPVPPNPDDFTPQLPPRPAQSIHPSARAQVPPSPVSTSTPIPTLPPRPIATGPSSAPADSPPLPSPPLPTPPLPPRPASVGGMFPPPPPPPPLALTYKGSASRSTSISRNDARSTPSPTASVSSSFPRTAVYNVERAYDTESINGSIRSPVLPASPRIVEPPMSSASTAVSFESARSYADAIPRTAATIGHSPVSQTVPFPAMDSARRSTESDKSERVAKGKVDEVATSPSRA